MSWSTPLTLAELLPTLSPASCKRLKTPPYRPDDRGHTTLGRYVALAVSSMKDHMTDEGWQVMLGLEDAGYHLWGHGCPFDSVNVPRILEIEQPSVVVVQDKREWDVGDGRNFRDPRAAFQKIRTLKEREDLFKVTILKDAQNQPAYHRESAEEMGCHAWIVYYHPDVVARLCPYLRPGNLIRTYHTLDPAVVPPYSPAGRRGCLISGALGGAYPLRSRLIREIDLLPHTEVLSHPGYHRQGCATSRYLQTLSHYKVALCTASRYGYALRKLIEATAAGCVVITDLPEEDELPAIDGNLIRVHPQAPTKQIAEIIRTCLEQYDPHRQRYYAREAIDWYDYGKEGLRLAAAIDRLREHYA